MKTDYEIRQETEKDYPQVFKLVEEAFRDMEESDHREQFLVERLRHSPAFVPELSLVADEDGGVVGYGLMTRVSIRSGILDAESLALAPVAVRPDRQSMGIGSALIRELHARAARLGYKSAVVLGHEGFYPRFGYRKASDYGIAFPFEVPSECCMAVELVAGGLRDILSGSFYGMTGTVRVGIDIRTKEQRAAHVRNLCPFVLLSYPIIRFVILSECQIRTRENRVYGGRASLRRF